MEYVICNNGTYYVQTPNGNSVTTNIALASRWKKIEKATNVLNHIRNNKVLKRYHFQVKGVKDSENISQKSVTQTENEIETIKTKRKVFNQEERAAIYRKTKGYCYLCGDFVDFNKFEVEHKIPISKGGTNDLSNLFCSCHVCNSIKQDIYPEDFMERISKIFMYQMENKYSKKMTWKMMSKKLHKMIGGN